MAKEDIAGYSKMELVRAARDLEKIADLIRMDRDSNNSYNYSPKEAALEVFRMIHMIHMCKAREET